MNRRRTALLLGAMLLTAARSLAGDPATDVEPGIAWQPFTGKAFDGSPLEGELGRLRVPETRAIADGGEIELAFVRFRTTNPRPGPPVFFLVGGPGASGTEFCAGFATHPQVRLLEHSDVIGLDQRGTGLSRPNLMGREFVELLPVDRAIDREDVLSAFDRAATECVRYWTQRGVRLTSYTTIESADDVDDLRRALGYDKIITYGTSYGSHLGLAHLRRHPGTVARAVLSRVEGPDHTWKLPGTAQELLQRLHDRVAADPATREHAPDLLGLVRGLLAQLEREPVLARIRAGTPEEALVRVGPHDLQAAIARALTTSPELARLPVALIRCSRGDWSWLAADALEARRIGIHAMPLMMDCASGGTPERLARIERERLDPANLLSDALMSPFYPAACTACAAPDLGEAFRAPFASETPVLFISGDLDARTPPQNVDELLAGFPRAGHVLVLNAGHDARELMSEEFRHLLQAFLRGETVESCTIALPPVLLEAIEAP